MTLNCNIVLLANVILNINKDYIAAEKKYGVEHPFTKSINSRKLGIYDAIYSLGIAREVEIECLSQIKRNRIERETEARKAVEYKGIKEIFEKSRNSSCA
jgi:hypothetical protein